MLRKTTTTRTFLFAIFFTIFFVLIGLRLYWTQVVDSARLMTKAKEMWSVSAALPAHRGMIFDRHGYELASDVEGFTVNVNPQLLAEYNVEDEVAAGLASLLDKPIKQVKEQVIKRNTQGILLKNVEIRREGWKMDRLLAERIKAWKQQFLRSKGITDENWAGVTVVAEQMRQYPKLSLASHVLGYVDKDGKAWMGLERSMDDWLRGTPGTMRYQVDRLGQKLPQSQPLVQPPKNGHHVMLTIDQTIQYIVEHALDTVQTTYRPKGMTAIVVDPHTMEILALANRPTFNPNTYWQFDASHDFINLAIQARYEPGSTFKLVTLAAAIEKGLFKPDDTYVSGSIRVPGHTIHDHRRGGWGKITYLEGLLRSSNVAFVKLGYEQLGEDALRQYIDKFGFTQHSGIDLPGEVDSRISFHYPSEVAAATFGQGGVIVTPMQQLTAYAAIANGGKLMLPYIVKQVIDPRTNKVVFERKPKVIREVVAPAVAQQVSAYLEQVISDQKRGTGRRAYVDGYRIAGKTGTANKVVGGSYAAQSWVVSLIGYAPVENPRLAVAVIVDEPDLGGDSNRAGEVTAPLFKEIMVQTLRYLNVPPKDVQQIVPYTTLLSAAGVSSEEMEANLGQVAAQQATIVLPDVTNQSVQEAKKTVEQHTRNVQVVGGGDRIVAQYPAAHEQIDPKTTVYLITKAENYTVPDLTGASLRDAMAICTLVRRRCEIQGEGYVVSQSASGAIDGVVVLMLESTPQRKTDTLPLPLPPQPAIEDEVPLPVP